MPDLLKLALSAETLAAMGRSVKGFGAGMGMGGLVGAGAGGIVGGIRGARKAQQGGQGASGTALGALGGAGRGAALGGALGAGVGGLAGAARPALAESLGARGGRLQSASHFGQRQLHAFTGVGSPEYVRSIGGGAADTAKELAEATHALDHAPLADAAKRRQAFAGAQRAHAASEKAEGMGLTSIPGYVKSLAKDPVGTLRAGFTEQWHNAGGTAGKALMYGLPAASVAHDISRKGGDEEGHGHYESIGRDIGFGASTVAGPIPIAGQLALGPLGARVGGGIGRVVDNLRSRRVPNTEPEPPGTNARSHDGYVYSDRAAGTVPESLG
jgi:hypothetical protein